MCSKKKKKKKKKVMKLLYNEVTSELSDRVQNNGYKHAQWTQENNEWTKIKFQQRQKI